MLSNPKEPSVQTHIVIPARFKSSRLPGKPLLNIHGKPMVLWVAEKASQANFADDVCIATDHDEIARVCTEAGYDVVMTSEKHLSGTDRLAEVAQLKGWNDSDIVINMQGDEPLVPPILLAQCKQLLEQDQASVMATLYESIDDYPTFNRASVVKVVADQLGRALYFSRSSIPCDREQLMSGSQSAAANTPPSLGKRHLGLYAYRVGLLKQFITWPQTPLESLESLEQLRILENGGKIAIAEATVSLPPGVDTQEDLDRLNAMSLSSFK